MHFEEINILDYFSSKNNRFFKEELKYAWLFYPEIIDNDKTFGLIGKNFYECFNIKVVKNNDLEIKNIKKEILELKLHLE